MIGLGSTLDDSLQAFGRIGISYLADRLAEPLSFLAKTIAALEFSK